MNEHAGKERGDMRRRLLEKIDRGDLHMRSRAVFVLRALALVLLVILALGASIFIFNYLFFFVRINLLQGHMRIFAFLMFFPWRLLVLDVAFLLIIEMLLREFRFAYRRSMLLVLFLLFALTLAIGIAIDRAGNFNERLENRANHGQLFSPISELYRHARHY